MPDAKKPESPPSVAERQARQAAALRENLKRRKNQARQRQEPPAGPQPTVHNHRPVR